MQADQINCLKPLEILDFGLALASRQPAPELKRTKRCVFFSWLKCLRGNRDDFAALHLQNLLVVFGFSCSFDFCV